MKPPVPTRAWRAQAIATCAAAVLVASAAAMAQKPAAQKAAEPKPVATAAAPAPATSGSTLARIRETGRIKFGYRKDARPFEYTDDSGQPAGYTVALCQQVAEAAKALPGLGALKVEWVTVNTDDRLSAIQDGRIDLLCGATTVTLSRRENVSFSIPVFPGGVGALVRADAPSRLKEVLSGRQPTYHPTWRGSPAQVLQARAFTAIRGTTGEQALTQRIKELQVTADVARVSSYEAGIQAVINRESDAFFAERAVLLDLAKRHQASRNLLVIDRAFTYEPLALAFARGDEDLRLLVDRALSRVYGSPAIGSLYATLFGEPDETVLTFFRWNTLPQ